ncbi:MAG: RluA family pseudouridine synthase, partial [Microcoleus sp.]
MTIGQALADFGERNWEAIDPYCNYWYEGPDFQSGELLRLPRTTLSEEIARCLMQQLAADRTYSREGKMYGILLVETPEGERRVLKAFSGLLKGSSDVEGWVPPIPGRDRVAVEEARTLRELDAIENELIAQKQLPQRLEYATLFSEFELQLQILQDRHRNSKQQRDERRQLLCQTMTGENLKIALADLDRASQLEGIERKQLKRRRDEILQPLKQAIASSDIRVRELKQRRKQISRQLQLQMHQAYSLLNFLGTSRSLQELIPDGAIPTGTGDCCAPKLLHYAAANNLKPLAMAEFWWGPTSGDKIQGVFYGACADRCQPLMGFLLSGIVQHQSGTIGQIDRSQPSQDLLTQTGLTQGIQSYAITSDSKVIAKADFSSQVRKSDRIDETEFVGENTSFQPAQLANNSVASGLCESYQLPIIYQDKWLIAVNKPAELLSVPGRYFANQDSVQSRLQNLLPERGEVRA